VCCGEFVRRHRPRQKKAALTSAAFGCLPIAANSLQFHACKHWLRCSLSAITAADAHPQKGRRIDANRENKRDTPLSTRAPKDSSVLLVPLTSSGAAYVRRSTAILCCVPVSFILGGVVVLQLRSMLKRTVQGVEVLLLYFEVLCESLCVVFVE